MRRTFKIAVLNSMRGYSARVLRGITRYARPDKPWSIHLFNPQEKALKEIAKWKPDGLLAEFHSEEQCAAFCKLCKAVVNYGFHIKGVPQIGQDDAAIGKMGAEYFLERGFRNFAYIGAPDVAFTSQRLAGFAYCIRTAGAPPPFAFAGRTTTDESIQKWIESLPKPIAMLASNDRWGWRISEICLNARISIPDDVSLLGCDNDELLCEMAWPPLSSIECRPDRIGYQAAKFLDALLHGKRVPVKPFIFQPQSIVTRRSSDIFAIGDADVAAALRFIREHITENIGVNDVVKVVSISRRALERKFQQHLRRTPLDEIHRGRLERAKILLQETDLPVPAVAAQSAFHDRQRFGALFKQRMGMTAMEYRKKLR
jgi:LacI family transcriptional regulator